METRIRIQPAAAADIETIVAHSRAGLLTAPVLADAGTEPGQWDSPPTPRALVQWLADGCLLVARGHGDLLACAALCLDARALSGLMLAPAAGNGGLAERMVAAVERLAVRFGLLGLHVSATRPSAEFYFSCGYRPTAPRDVRASELHMQREFPQRQTRFGRRIAALGQSLGIAADYGVTHRLGLQPECRRVTSIGPNLFGREAHLAPRAARAWLSMQAAARKEGHELQAVSGFRTVSYQAGIVTRKLDAGQSIDEILRVSAAPGFSEHHSGRALDVTTPGFPPLEESFENSPAYQWLTRSADRFGFRLSYPPDNRHGVAYEPWHWCWHA